MKEKTSTSALCVIGKIIRTKAKKVGSSVKYCTTRKITSGGATTLSTFPTILNSRTYKIPATTLAIMMRNTSLGRASSCARCEKKRPQKALSTNICVTL
ncbi:MAG: hypothetical protein RLZZ308_193 [Candidatus Parcubacteria bacterium]